MPPLVSIVMGVYNDAERVPAAIESIRAQTLSDWELIVVDDGSTDQTPAVLDDYQSQDRRIRVIRQQNSGLTRALIAGCSAATGEFIARQDADDVSLPQRLQRQAECLLSHPHVGLVSSWTDIIGPQDEPLEVVRRPVDPTDATRLLVVDHQGPPAHGSVMFRRELSRSVGGYRPEFHFAQDIDLWLRMTEHSQLAYIDEVLYRWRRCNAGISAARHAQQSEFGRLAFACRAARDRGETETAQLTQAAELTAAVKRDYVPGRAATSRSSAMSYIIGTQLARRGDRRAYGYLWSVLRQRPWDWRAWARIVQSGWNSRRKGTSAVTESWDLQGHQS
jgi:glycosyltransferase involved in cell wall biosynthesis